MGENYYSNRNRYTDDELVRCYLESEHSQIKAAKTLGISRETVARAVRRAGIKMDGCKYNRGPNNPNPKRKVTDEQLLFLYKDMNCIQIAKQFNMSPGQVYNRLRGLGINPRYGARSVKDRIEAYGFNAEIDSSITLDAVVEKYKGICKLCGKPVDYHDCAGGRSRKNYPSIDHIIPLSKGGSHTWENVQLAHIGCNARKWNN